MRCPGPRGGARPRRRPGTRRSPSGSHALAADIRRLEDAGRRAGNAGPPRVREELLTHRGSGARSCGRAIVDRRGPRSTRTCAPSTTCARTSATPRSACVAPARHVRGARVAHQGGAPRTRIGARRGRAARRGPRHRRIRPDAPVGRVRRDRAGVARRGVGRSGAARARWPAGQPPAGRRCPGTLGAGWGGRACRGGGAGRTGQAGGRAGAHRRRNGPRPAGQDRSHGPRQHDGHRSVRRPGDAPSVPDDAAQGPHRRDRRRPARPSRRSTRPRGSASPRRSRSSTRTSRRRSRRCSAAAAPA